MTDPDVIAPATLAMYGAFLDSSKAAKKVRRPGDDPVKMPYYGEGDS